MDRKEFLIYLAMLALAITGVTNILKILSNPHSSKMSSVKGFGGGPYGG